MRVSIRAFDIPHLAPNLTQAADALTVMTIHNSAKHASKLTIPAID